MDLGLRRIAHGKAVGAGPTLEDVVWTQIVGCTASGNNLTKTGAAGFNAGAVSSKAILSGPGYMEFTISEINTARFVGLSNGNSGVDYFDIDFSWYMKNDDTLRTWENGNNRGGSWASYVTGKKCRIEVSAAGVITYLYDGILKYTSLATAVFPLLVDCSLNHTGATINGVVLYGVLGASGY